MTPRRPALVLLPPAPADGSRRHSLAGALGPLLMAIFALSGFASGYYAQRIYLPLALALLALAAAALVGFGVPREAPARLALAGLGGLLAWTALSMTWAESVERAWAEVDRLVLYAAVLLVGLQALRSTRAALAALGVLVAAAGVFAAVVVIRLLAADAGLFVERRLHEPLGYINGTAGLLLMGAWPALAFAVGLRRRRGLAAAALGLATVLFGLLLLTQSRAVVPAAAITVVVLLAVPDRLARAAALVTAVAATACAAPWTLTLYGTGTGTVPGADIRLAGVAVALAGGLAAAAWWVALSLRHRPPARAVATGLVAFALGGGALAVVVGVGNPVTAVRDGWQQFRSLEVDTTVSSRFLDAGGFRYDLWRIAVDDFRAAPLKGVGAGNYDLGYYQARTTPQSVRQPHSLPLQLLAELGLLGGVLLAVFVGGAGWGAARLVRGRDPAEWMLAAGAGGTLVTWLVHTSVDWLYNLPGLTGIALLCAAALCARPAAAPVHAGRKVFVAAALVPLALAAAATVRHYAAIVQRDRAQDAIAADPARALSTSAASLRLDAESVDTLIVRAAAFARLGGGTEADATLARAERLEPHNYVPPALRGDLAVRARQLAAARRHYARAARLNPLDPGLSELRDDPRKALAG